MTAELGRLAELAARDVRAIGPRIAAALAGLDPADPLVVTARNTALPFPRRAAALAVLARIADPR